VWVWAVSERKKKALKIVEAPHVGAALEAPPALTASTQTVAYTCGYCGSVLMHADEGQVHELIIRCTSCGSYNETE
jgi:DNA-directed RNA polymerase subunit RPC12/RpoP